MRAANSCLNPTPSDGTVSESDSWLDAYVKVVEGFAFPVDLMRLLRHWKRDWILAERRVAAYRGEPRQEFWDDRHHTIGMMLAVCVSTQYERGLDLPPAVMEHPAVLALRWALARRPGTATC